MSRIIPAPGTGRRPICVETCEHEGCAELRRYAASSCHVCGDPIGYDTEYRVDGSVEVGDGRRDALRSHVACEAEGDDR